ncbi:hypothetical protein PMIN06_011909 [Paraphaeosphaeria minitans]
MPPYPYPYPQEGLSESDAFDNYIGIDGSVSVAIITGIVFGTIALWLLVFLALVVWRGLLTWERGGVTWKGERLGWRLRRG